MMLMSGRNYVWQVRMSNGCGKNLKIEQLVGIICVGDRRDQECYDSGWENLANRTVCEAETDPWSTPPGCQHRSVEVKLNYNLNCWKMNRTE